MNQNQRTQLALALTKVPNLNYTLLRILVYCVLTHTDGFEYSASGLETMTGIPQQSIQDNASKLEQLNIWTLKEKREGRYRKPCHIYDFHYEGVKKLVEGVNRDSVNRSSVNRTSVDRRIIPSLSNSVNTSTVQSTVPPVNRESVDSHPKHQLPPHIQKRIDEYKLGLPVGKSIQGWS